VSLLHSRSRISAPTRHLQTRRIREAAEGAAEAAADAFDRQVAARLEAFRAVAAHAAAAAAGDPSAKEFEDWYRRATST
jgi:hypothetical protein